MSLSILSLFKVSGGGGGGCNSRTCTSWNNRECHDEDAVYCGPRGDRGSCYSNRDCPCCAPFCSGSGYCHKTQF